MNVSPMRTTSSQDHFYQRPLPPAELLIAGPHVLDPRTGLDEPHDVLIRDGHIAELAAPGSLSGATPADTIEAAGKHLFPGFVDPHVHLRTPGQEYKEDVSTGTAAAAAGGFVAVIAMPNTDPLVDDATVLRSLVDSAKQQASVPTGTTLALSVRMGDTAVPDATSTKKSSYAGPYLCTSWCDSIHAVEPCGM